MNNGKKNWWIVDGYLPYKGEVKDANFEGHEAIMILNCAKKPAKVLMDIYFEDRDPIKDVEIIVEGERVRCLRIDHPEDIGGTVIDRQVQYSLRFRSNRNVVIQYGRMDIAQPNLSYLGFIGYSE